MTNEEEVVNNWFRIIIMIISIIMLWSLLAKINNNSTQDENQKTFELSNYFMGNPQTHITFFENSDEITINDRTINLKKVDYINVYHELIKDNKNNRLFVSFIFDDEQITLDLQESNLKDVIFIIDKINRYK